MVREKSGKSQGILLYSNCGHPVVVSHVNCEINRTKLLTENCAFHIFSTKSIGIFERLFEILTKR